MHRSLRPEDESLDWSRGSDEYGEVLLLRGPDTSWRLFRPMDG